jgi:EpsI family protein
MLTRAALAAALIVACGVYTRGATGPEHPAARMPLSSMPFVLGDWHGSTDPPLAADVLRELGVDDYISRHYAVAGASPVAVYVGYYASQRQGDTIHSPQNCLPGAGWHPVFSDRTEIAAGGSAVPVNRVLIQKGMERQAVLYWYQGRGRIVATEFRNKGWLMLDAARLRRTDGGLVRLMTPVTGTADEAFARLSAFSAALVPGLGSHLP